MTYILVPCSEHINIKDHKLINLIKCNSCSAHYECSRCDNMFITTKDRVKSNTKVSFICASCCNKRSNKNFIY